ncbi:MAG TPA: AIR synthase related protein, partial [Polyangia bacterium]|nr:AIR synthase related protein [Polyangia bacterium]
MRAKNDRILLGHGGGGLLSRELIDAEIIPRFGDGPLRGLPDAARLEAGGTALVFSTDSFVVQPLEFAGGDIGCLAVHGTVNDIAVAGGRPRWLSLGLILEEGLELAVLRRVLDSIAR